MPSDPFGMALESRNGLSGVVWQRVQADSCGSLVSRAVFWDARFPLRVGGSGQGIIARHPDDMRAPSRAVTFFLPLCQSIAQRECPPCRMNAGATTRR
ncbi:MAG: hypothetical protein P8104_03645 [Gammaproteobacteria bacterium]